MTTRIIYLLLLYSGVVILALKKECPPEDTLTCYCDLRYGPSILCSGGNVQGNDDLNYNLESMIGYDIGRFTLQDVTLTEAKKDTFKGQRISHLTLDNVNVIGDSFEEGFDFFQGLENSLGVLNIKHCYTQGTPLNHFKVSHLHKLKTLIMHDNKIEEVGNDWFPDGPNTLTTIILSRNEIKKLADKAFTSLKSLKILFVTDNPLTEITRSMFPMPAPLIQKMSFASNKIRELPMDIFSYMPNLKSVILDNNLITTIKEYIPPGGVHQAIKYYLSGNPIKCDNDVKWLCDGNVKDIQAISCESPEAKKGIIFSSFCDMES